MKTNMVMIGKIFFMHGKFKLSNAKKRRKGLHVRTFN